MAEDYVDDNAGDELPCVDTVPSVRQGRCKKRNVGQNPELIAYISYLAVS